MSLYVNMKLFEKQLSRMLLNFALTAIFILAVSSVMLLHDVSARAGDVLMGIAVFPIGCILLLPFDG